MKKIILVLMLLIFIVSFTFATEVERRPALKQLTMQEFEKTTGKKITQYNEAPMLKNMVERGELPPVEERLPESPVVLETLDKIGQYGGTWRRAQVGETYWVWTLVNFESLGMFDCYGENIIPELAKEWTFNDDYTEMTLKIHEGIKWSDGSPFTVDDFIFFWEEVVLGKDDHGNSSPHAYLALPWTMRGGEPMKLQKIDNYTMKFIFAAPNPTAPVWFQTGHSRRYIWPTHWIKQYHPKYNDNIDTWEQMEINLKPNGWTNTEQPVLNPWKAVEYLPGQRLTMERNPYFWKVDYEGNQLPYIDRVVIEFLSDIETLKLKLIRGEVDFQVRDELTSFDYPMLAANQQVGDYTLKLYHTGRGAQPCLYPNLNSENKILRDFFRNQKVRIALSIGINREYINELIYNGLMKPYSATIGADSWHFKVPGGQELLNEWQQTYAEFDPERANRLLDEAGYAKGSDGWRHFPDGKPIEFIATLRAWDQNKRYLDVMQIVKENWADLGVDLIVDDVSVDEWTNSQQSANYDVLVYESSDLDAIAWPVTLVPMGNPRSWGKVTDWFISGGTKGVDPAFYANNGEGDVELRLLNLYEKWLSLPGDAASQERYQLVHEAIRIHIDEGPFMIGVVGEPTIPGIVKNNFKNVGDFMITGPHFLTGPRNMYPEQFYIEQ